MKPFDLQHPVEGAFGDPRTLVPDQAFGQTDPAETGAYSFHDGIDIGAQPGTPVYPVISGRVALHGQHEIIIHTDDGRSFQYDDLARAVRSGQVALRDRTVLGWVQAPFDHVHLAEIDPQIDGLCRLHNPLASGHLEPYEDSTTPTASDLYLVHQDSSISFEDRPLRPDDRLAVAAADPAAGPTTWPYLGLPQVPALVEWRLADAHTNSTWQIAADFRTTEPPRRDFWKVYAPGTYQNSPVFDHALFTGSPGQYLFRLGLDPSRILPGHYLLQVRVADIRENQSTTSWPVTIQGH